MPSRAKISQEIQRSGQLKTSGLLRNESRKKENYDKHEADFSAKERDITLLHYLRQIPQFLKNLTFKPVL